MSLALLTCAVATPAATAAPAPPEPDDAAGGDAPPAPAVPRIDTSGELPCSVDELTEALALRVDAAAIRVEVAGERVRVGIGARWREVALDGARGRDAARLIAFAAADLAMDELPAGAPAPASVTTTAPVLARARTARAPGAIDLTVSGRVGTSAALRGGLALDAALGRGRWRPTLEAGLVGGGVGVTGDDDVLLLGAPLRAGLQWGDDGALRATALAIPFLVRGGDGDVTLVPGAGVEGRGRILRGAVTVIVAAGVDVLARQVEYRYAGATVMTTPWVQAWTALGVTWGLR